MVEGKLTAITCPSLVLHRDAYTKQGLKCEALTPGEYFVFTKCVYFSRCIVQ